MNWKILIVDDELPLTALLQRQFTDYGYTVFVANNSSEALKLLKEQPDIILLDINMPGKDGLALCREIRESVSYPILFLTARIMEQDKLAGFREGGDDYITKPFSLEELTARVEAHLRREQRNKTSSARLKRYTDSLQDIYRTEEQELHKTTVLLPELMNDIAEDFALLAEKEQIQLIVTNSVPACRMKLDGQVFYRILENVFVNALRFAETQIQIHFLLENDMLTVRITDDGPGFPESILQKNNFVPTTTDQTGKHIGLGLAICSVLCRKHGGSLKLENQDCGGARTVIQILVDKF